MAPVPGAPAPEVVAPPVEEVPPATRAGRRRWIVVAAIAAVVVAALVVVARLPWEWSLIDDNGLVDLVHGRVRESGPVGGFLSAVQELYRTDLDWGLFRPAYWVYVAAFYQLPVGPAHAVRVAMLVCAFAGAVAAVVDGSAGARRLLLGGWTLLAIAANGAIFMGVWYPSLQELSGLCFVGLGLLARRHPWLLVACWAVAAWFKSPFSWLLLAYGLLLCRQRGTRAPGVAALLVAVPTLGAAALLARGGHYTNDVATLDPGAIRAHAETAFGLLGPPALVLLAGALVFRSRPGSTGNPLAWALLAGGTGYLANMLLWRTDAYYAGPYLYLLTLGGLLLLRDIQPVPGWRLAGLVVPVLIAGEVAGFSALTGWYTHANVTGLRDCMLRLPPGSVIGFNRVEGWARLDSIVRARDPGWTGKLVLVRDGQTVGEWWSERVDRVDYYIHQPSYGPGSPALMTGPVVCRTKQSTVYRVK
jgi:hypothetical protein